MHTRIWVFVCYRSVIIIHDFRLYFDVFWYFGVCQVMLFFGFLAQVLIRWAKFCQLHPNDLKERKWLSRIVFILMLGRVNCVWWGIITQNYWVLESFLLGTFRINWYNMCKPNGDIGRVPAVASDFSRPYTFEKTQQKLWPLTTKYPLPHLDFPKHT